MAQKFTREEVRKAALRAYADTLSMNNEIKMDAFAVWNYLSAMYGNDPSVDLKKVLDASWRVYSELEEQA